MIPPPLPYGSFSEFWQNSFMFLCFVCEDFVSWKKTRNIYTGVLGLAFPIEGVID